MEIRPNVRYPVQTDAAISYSLCLSSAQQRRSVILPLRLANSRLQTVAFVTMQVPPPDAVFITSTRRRSPSRRRFGWCESSKPLDRFYRVPDESVGRRRH